MSSRQTVTHPAPPGDPRVRSDEEVYKPGPLNEMSGVSGNTRGATTGYLLGKKQ